MARTAPSPNLSPGVGMCLSVAVKGGGVDVGRGQGRDPSDGDGDAHAGGDDGGDDASSDQKNAPDHEKYPECGSVSHPIDVVTGRVFTHPIREIVLPGPLPLRFERTYSSAAKDRDVGLGFGWAHSLGWEIEVGRRRLMVWTDRGVGVPFHTLSLRAQTIGPWGWLLYRDGDGFILDADDGIYRRFAKVGKRFLLTILADRNNNRIKLTYDYRGHLLDAMNDAGKALCFQSTPRGRIAALEVHDAPVRGRSITFARYTYDEEGNLTSATDAESHVARYAYDDRHRLIQDTDRTGLTFHFRYDDHDRGVESWGDYGDARDPSLIDDLPKWLADGVTRAEGIHHSKLRFGPHGDSDVADSTQVRRFFGNNHGLIDKRVEGGGVVTAAYDDHGHLTSRTDATGATTTYVRDPWGREVARTDPLGRTTRTERDPHGLPLRVIDPAGGEWTWRRDAHGNALDWTEPTGTITSATYDKRGLMTSIQGSTGAQTRMTYDRDGNCIEQVDPNGATWRWTYDTLGRCTSETDPLGATTRLQWSDRGDLVAIIDAAGGITRYVYDGERRVIEVIDPLGHVTRQTWGGYHRLVEITDPNGDTVRLRYNREGEQVEVHNAAGEVHRRTYNPAGLLVEEHTFDGRRLIYRHDRAGRVTRFENGARERVDMVYNAAGELTERHLSDASVERFDHDLRGDLIRITWPGGELTFDRDTAGRLVRETLATGGQTATVEATLDRNGDRTMRRTSLGLVEVIERDAMGARIRTMLDAKHEITHERDLLEREVSVHLPGGGQIDTAYGPLGQLARRWVTAPAPAHPLRLEEPGWSAAQPPRLTIDKNYVHDLSGALTDVWDRRRGWMQVEHDAAGRLLCAFVEKRGREVFRYDAAGNLFEEGPDAEAREYGPGGRLLRKGTTTYRWDEDGRLIEKRRRIAEGKEQVWGYAWNAAGLLAAVVMPDRRRIAFAYDPLGRRLEACLFEPGAGGRLGLVERTRFVWDGDTIVHAIRERTLAEGAPLVEERTYCFDDGSFLPRAHCDMGPDGSSGRVSRWAFYVNDAVGTPEELVGADGAELAALDRRAWGRTEEDPKARASTPLRFQGQVEDLETGLFYNRFRYYDPDAGLFISADPIGLAGGLHPFAYVPSPFGWVDAFGLAPTPLNAPGYAVYGLYAPGATEPYYVGMTNDLNRREDEHTQNGRLIPGARQKPFTGSEDLTYAQARGHEQAYMEHLRTKGPYPGNKRNSIDPRRTDSRGRVLHRECRAKLRNLGK